jgi:hypothetical protein
MNVGDFIQVQLVGGEKQFVNVPASAIIEQALIKRAQINITTAQMQALVSTPITLVEGVADKTIIPLMLIITFSGANPFSDGGALSFRHSGITNKWFSDISGVLWGSTFRLSRNQTDVSQTGTVPDLNNIDFQIEQTSGSAFTGGNDATITVTTFYDLL